MKLNEKMIMLRKGKGISQEALAELMGVSRQSVSKWENGLSKPSTRCLERLCDIYDITINELMASDLKVGIIYDSEETLKQLIQKRKRLVIGLIMSFIVIFIAALIMQAVHIDENLVLIVAGISATLMFCLYLVLIVSIVNYVYKDCIMRQIHPKLYVVLSLTLIGLLYYLLKRETLSQSKI